MDGIIVIDKEKDYTSHDVVAIVKKTLNEKAGHIGTLDPNAMGVLPILIGKGTKLSKYLIEHDKTYKAKLKLGIRTDTKDIFGKILETRPIEKEEISIKQIKIVLQNMIGIQKQYPPMYSAIKINGKKLYEYARNGEEIEIKPRTIEIYDINLDDFNGTENEITFTVKCSKGTYIRSLCEDIASKLNTIGCMKELDRLQVGRFNKEQAVKIDILKENKENKDFLNKYIIPFEEVVKDKSCISLTNAQIQLLLNGVKLSKNLEDGIYRVKNENNVFIGTGEIKNKLLKRDIII